MGNEGQSYVCPHCKTETKICPRCGKGPTEHVVDYNGNCTGCRAKHPFVLDSTGNWRCLTDVVIRRGADYHRVTLVANEFRFEEATGGGGTAGNTY